MNQLEGNIEKPISTGDKICFSFSSLDNFESAYEETTNKISFFELRFFGLNFEINKKTKISFSNFLDKKYFIFEIIGRGSFATVRRGINIKTKEEIAIKIINRNIIGFESEEKWKNQQNEAKLLKNLKHKSIIRLVETLVTEEKIFICMEYVSGGELFERLVKGKYKESRAKLLMRNILEGLEYLHKRNIIHRDLKPENILLTSKSTDVEIKLVDFGVAKEVKDGRKTFVGSFVYIAPEVLEQRNSTHMPSYGKSADIWSLGIICYIVLCGVPPFRDDSELTMEEELKQVMKFTRPSSWDGVSEEAKDFISKMLVVDASKRLTVEECLQHKWFKSLKVSLKRALTEDSTKENKSPLKKLKNR